MAKGGDASHNSLCCCAGAHRSGCQQLVRHLVQVLQVLTVLAARWRGESRSVAGTHSRCLRSLSQPLPYNLHPYACLVSPAGCRRPSPPFGIPSRALPHPPVRCAGRTPPWLPRVSAPGMSRPAQGSSKTGGHMRSSTAAVLCEQRVWVGIAGPVAPQALPRTCQHFSGCCSGERREQ